MHFSIVEPDRVKLNDFAIKNEYGTIFQSGHILDVYQDVPNCYASSLAVIDESDNIIASIVSVKFVEKKKLGYFSSHSTIRGGPLWEDSERGEKAVLLLLNEYNNISKKKSLYSRIYPNFNPHMRDILTTCGFEFEDDLNIFIDLTLSEDELWANLHKNRRTGVRKAKKNGVIIKEVESMVEIDDFYNMLVETSNVNHISVRDLKLFHNIYSHLVPEGLAKIYLALYDEKPIAGLLSLNYKDTLYDWYACSTKNRDYLRLNPNEYLVWNTLYWGLNNGYSLFDFGGAGNPKEEYSVRDFKNQFGGSVENYGKYTKIHNSMVYNICEKGYDVYRKIF